MLSKEEPYLLARYNDPDYLEMVRSLNGLMESGDESNIMVSLEIMKTGGVPQEVMTGLFITAHFIENVELQKEAKKLLMQNAPLPLLIKLQKTSYIDIAGLAKAGLDRTKIAAAWFRYTFQQNPYEAAGRAQSLWKYFTSEIRREVLKKLFYQNGLDLSGFHFKKTPIELAGFTNLKILDLGNNKLTELPVFLHKFRSLEKLSLADNAFETFPASLSTLKELQILHLSKNPLYAFPDEIKLMENLKELHLKEIALEEDAIKNLKSLLPKCKLFYDAI